MSLLACLKNNFKSSAAFTLLEILIVISLSVVIMSVFISLAADIYDSHRFQNMISAGELDGYLAADFIFECVKNSSQILQQQDDQLELYCFYGGKRQWLSFSRYSRGSEVELRKSLGGEDPASADFGRSGVLINGLDDLIFELDNQQDLLIIKLIYDKENYKNVIRRRINLQH